MFIKGSKRLAIVDENGEKINFYHLENSIKYLSRVILKEINKDDKVLIYAENSLNWIYRYFAIWDREAIPVCIDSISNEKELDYYIKDSGAKHIICCNENIENIKNKDINILNMNEFIIEKLEDNIDLSHPISDNLALMIYTSGTTGDPKGVMLSFNNLIGEIDAVSNLGITYDDEQTIAILPFHHILPLMSTMLYYLYYKNSYSVVLCPKISSESILKCLSENRVTMISSVPRLYKLFEKSIRDKIESSFVTRCIYKLAKLINNKKFSKFIFKKVHKKFGPCMRSFVSGGAKADEKMMEFFEVLGFNFYEGYGLSETAPLVMGCVPKHHKIGTVGKPVDSVNYKLVNGELYVKGPMVMLGYYNKPDKTSEVLTKDGWFKTGDLASVDDEGYISIVGRVNNMIVLSNGKNIDPSKLEDRIIDDSKNMILETGIFSKNDKLVALIVPNMKYIKDKKIGNIKTFIRDIIQIYNQKVHNYEKILEYKVINKELPKTRVGKLQRFKLKSIFENIHNDKEKVIEPTTTEYIVLKKYIKKTKYIENILPTSNLEIDLAMDSLDFVEFRAYIESSFNINLPDDIFLTHSNLKLLSEYVIEKEAKFTESTSNIKDIISKTKKVNVKTGYLVYLLRPILYAFGKIYFRFSIKTQKIKNRPTIFIANHESFIDAALLNYAIPFEMRKNTYFLAIDIYFKSKIAKYFAENNNVVTIDIEKNIKSSIEKLAGIIKNGKNVFIFPEGSRTKNGNLAEFKKVFAILSKELNVPIRCLGIKGAFEAYGRFTKFPKPKKIEVEVLEEVMPNDLDYEKIVEKCFGIIKKFKEK